MIYWSDSPYVRQALRDTAGRMVIAGLMLVAGWEAKAYIDRLELGLARQQAVSLEQARAEWKRQAQEWRGRAIRAEVGIMKQVQDKKACWVYGDASQ